MPCLDCPRCKKIQDDLTVKLLETHRHGGHWAARQRHNSNKAQRLHDELNHVDIEPLEDLYWQMKGQLYQLEPPRSNENILGDFIFIKKSKKCFIFYILFSINFIINLIVFKWLKPLIYQ